MGHLPPGLRYSLPQLTCHQVLCHLCDQALIICRLIVMLSPNFRVAYTPTNHLDIIIIAALICNCLGLQCMILGGSCLVNVPSADTPSSRSWKFTCLQSSCGTMELDTTPARRWTYFLQ
jgi:hypothetical protein